MGLHISDIREFYEKGHYTAKFPVGVDKFDRTKLSANYIFDEELSVKRNREMVVEHNQLVDELERSHREKQAELYNKLTNDVVEYIKEYYDLTDKQARTVESFVYREHHSFMCDYVSYIDTFAEFASNLVNSED